MARSPSWLILIVMPVYESCIRAGRPALCSSQKTSSGFIAGPSNRLGLASKFGYDHVSLPLVPDLSGGVHAHRCLQAAYWALRFVVFVWHNQSLQATRGFAFLFVVAQVPRAPEFGVGPLAFLQRYIKRAPFRGVLQSPSAEVRAAP
jgi:hypothetical protein